jgi:hypothetical protein
MKLISDGKPLYLALEKGKTFRLIEDWKLDSDSWRTIVVPKGYRSDSDSIPTWIFWWQWGAWNIAAIAHDYIYEHGYIWREFEEGLKPIYLGKEEADLLFYEICLFLGVSPITAKLMFWAVCWFGRGGGD